jgi:hypothetical protein
MDQPDVFPSHSNQQIKQEKSQQTFVMMLTISADGN